MASHDVFMSSPLRLARRESRMTMSSSPDLPSLQDLLLPKPKPKPATLRSGSRAAPIPDDATTSFTTASSLWKSAQAQAATSHSPERPDLPEPIIDVDAPAAVVEVPSPTKPRPRKPRRRKDKPEPEPLPPTGSPSKEQPWKKYKAKADDQEPEETNEEMGAAVTQVGTARAKSRKQTGTMSGHFQRKPESKARKSSNVSGEQPQPKVVKATKVDIEEPLQLEQAMARRLDWTPPKQKIPVVIPSDSPTVEGEPRSTAEDGIPHVFENIMEAYGCKDIAPPPVVPSLEDESDFLKKRKRIELLPATGVDTGPESRERSPVKERAAKKKPRTITALATAIYKQPTQPEPVDPSVSLHDFFPANEQGGEKSKTGNKGKAPAKPRKRTAKAKKPVPPKPILLSPSAALKQVAKQDFVFGTSSQLATEHSPSFLRDLQSALRRSNQLDYSTLETPINSDAVEPPEQGNKLWDAAARDADGDLFDLELVNLADASPELPPMHDESDPFGYVRGEEEQAPSLRTGNEGTPRSDDSFVNLSDILPPSGVQPSKVSDPEPPPDGSRDLGGANNARLAGHGKPGMNEGRTSTASAVNLSNAALDAIYTATRLSSDDSIFWSTPAKNRSVTVALLGSSPHIMPQRGQRRPASVAAMSTVAAPGAGGVSGPDALTTSPKHARGRRKNETVITEIHESSSSLMASEKSPKQPRGRPRKASLDQPEMQEPPPSAQAPPNPKRPRGRPRKEGASPSKAAVTKATRKKAASAKNTARSVSPPKAPTTPPRVIYEIADSESEISASPSSSPDPTFSPPAAVDLSMSLDEDTELSLTMSPTEQQVPVFTHISKAITTAPRTRDPQHPSWHEKILLYDPIILEDLADWLNSGQLAGVGYDGAPVSPNEVKKWCESKSVCCLWKVSLRGKERKRY